MSPLSTSSFCCQVSGSSKQIYLRICMNIFLGSTAVKYGYFNIAFLVHICLNSSFVESLAALLTARVR